MISIRRIAFAIPAFFLISHAHAAVAPENLPSMDNLAALLGTTDKETVEKSIAAEGGRISSGLPAGKGARGETATEISALLSGGDKKQEQQLKTAIMDEREAFESVLTRHHFDTDDMGVAYATSFITLWELASHKQLPLEGSLEAGKFLVYTMKEIQPKYATISERDKERGHDWLMTTPVAFASLVKGFEQAGRKQEAKQLRAKSATLFKELFRLPHDTIIITSEGNIKVDTDRLLDSGGTGNSEADSLIDQSLQMENLK